ncbi:hypothetical protein H9Q08_19240 [Chryseobacterium sp. PS-8]|uniref:Nucleoside phosphorylase domain-containing protein n=1 Tax=Chryseobacterium indicum TaxID=2766954 RepID=A0ABS9CA11_9FLAO|nr:hypothetical protein [Chryseobacterium sp. PS-8]MCF2221410.1 hypothetical protein [Chryseobacterium sp. PS-8]
MNETHRELKVLYANLLRLDAHKYFNSKEFNYVILENDWDYPIKIEMMTKGRMNSNAKLESFIALLNTLIFQWIKYPPNSNNANTVRYTFNQLAEKVIISYINWNDEIKDYTKLIDSLKQIGPIEKSTINNVEKAVEQKNKISEKQNEIMTQQKETLELNANYDYAIITALEEDEMEQILPLVETIEDDGHFRKGYFKSNPEKKVILASQLETGMVDASILATEIIMKFNPKYLIMPGVLGGKPKDTKIGDVIVANKVFTVDKGKIKDSDFFKEIEASTINNSKITAFKSHKIKIQDYIRDSHPTHKAIVNIHFDPIACVRQVIDQKGFFLENFTSIERKTIGVEMESYGVTRACELIGDKQTIPIIIKSVMDNTQDKTDGAKKFAAWTSAKFLDYIIKNDLI